MFRALGKLAACISATFILLSVVAFVRPENLAAAGVAAQPPRPERKVVLCTCGESCECDCPSPYVCCNEPPPDVC